MPLNASKSVYTRIYNWTQEANARRPIHHAKFDQEANDVKKALDEALGRVPVATNADNGKFLRVTSGSWVKAILTAGDIPNLATGKITSGTFVDARIPNLATGKITSGVFDVRRVATVTTRAAWTALASKETNRLYLFTS